jgi:hypothetical protein
MSSTVSHNNAISFHQNHRFPDPAPVKKDVILQSNHLTFQWPNDKEPLLVNVEVQVMKNSRIGKK